MQLCTQENHQARSLTPLRELMSASPGKVKLLEDSKGYISKVFRNLWRKVVGWEDLGDRGQVLGGELSPSLKPCSPSRNRHCLLD